jgi:crotonobetainyl-CoA:carnitine CoA-transferase CaiB-like acyl-CoA transferase
LWGSFQTIEHSVARAARAPLLGEHNRAIYGDLLEYSPEDLDRLKVEGVV